jgi:hypothetical protein
MDKVMGLALITLSHLSIMANKDEDQGTFELLRILREIEPWGIQRQDVHRGTSKRVYVKGPTDIDPKQPWAYLTSVKQAMAHPQTLVKEYKYTRYLHERFPEWIVEELPLAEENRPLARILNARRGLLITKKPIVRNSIGPNSTLDDMEQLLVFMMESTDALIDEGFANSDLKVANIGITDKLRINDNGANMFHPIPPGQRKYFRDAIKLVGLLNLEINKELFDKYKHLYPELNFEYACSLFEKELSQDEKEAVITHAKTVMRRVTVDGKEEDLSSLFDDILFPETVLTHYGTGGTNDSLVFIEKLERMGLVPQLDSEVDLMIKEEKRRRVEKARIERKKEHQQERTNSNNRGNNVHKRTKATHNANNTTKRSKPSPGNGHSKSKKRPNASASPRHSSRARNSRASNSRG